MASYEHGRLIQPPGSNEGAWHPLGSMNPEPEAKTFDTVDQGIADLGSAGWVLVTIETFRGADIYWFKKRTD